jgi:hypothetical protein
MRPGIPHLAQTRGAVAARHHEAQLGSPVCRARQSRLVTAGSSAREPSHTGAAVWPIRLTRFTTQSHHAPGVVSPRVVTPRAVPGQHPRAPGPAGPLALGR